MGEGPVIAITKEMRSGVNIMRKFMSLNKQTEVVGKANLDTNLGGFANQFPEGARNVAARLGQKIGG